MPKDLETDQADLPKSDSTEVDDSSSPPFQLPTDEVPDGDISDVFIEEDSDPAISDEVGNNDETVPDVARLSKWLTENDWEPLNESIRKGHVSVIPTERLKILLTDIDFLTRKVTQLEAQLGGFETEREMFGKMVTHLKVVSDALSPLHTHKEELLTYVDNESPFFINTSKLMSEAGELQMKKTMYRLSSMVGNKKEKPMMPVARLFRRADWNAIMEIDIDKLAFDLGKCGVQTNGLMEIIEESGITELIEANASTEAEEAKPDQ